MREYLSDKWRSFLNKLGRIHKTIDMWFNGLVGTSVVILPYIQDQMPLFKPYLQEQVFLNIMLVILIVNAILHFRKM